MHSGLDITLHLDITFLLFGKGFQFLLFTCAHRLVEGLF